MVREKIKLFIGVLNGIIMFSLWYMLAPFDFIKHKELSNLCEYWSTECVRKRFAKCWREEKCEVRFDLPSQGPAYIEHKLGIQKIKMKSKSIIHTRQFLKT
jgi:hypothetical protein